MGYIDGDSLTEKNRFRTEKKWKKNEKKKKIS